MGKYHKKDIKQMALDRGYVELAKKSESYEICFIPDNDYRGFLKRRVEGLEKKVSGGDFITKTGEVVGKHDGYPFYTIGQRKLGVSLGSNPTYVIGINPNKNTVVVGTKEDLRELEMTVRNVNLVKYHTIPDGLRTVTKVRYKHSGEQSVLSNADGDIKVTFHHKVEGIAPGQSAVFYEGNDKKMGNVIVISHENGYITKYMHNKKNFVKTGDAISLNKAIGEMGKTGSVLSKAEGIHLHFELWENGSPIDPLPFIKGLDLIDSNLSDLKK